jgi:hypothetical protein
MNKERIFITPAYGRIYKTNEDYRKAWLAGLDFKIIDGPYCSIRDKEYIELHYTPTFVRQLGDKFVVVSI